MYGVNKVILVGTVGQDPRVTDFSNGGKVAQTSLATSKKGYTRRDGSKVDDTTEWHNIIFHDALAGVVAQYVKKGTNLYLEGELRTRKYVKDNVEHFTTEIHVNDMHMLPSKNDGQQQQTAQPVQASVQPTVQQATANNQTTDPNLPF